MSDDLFGGRFFALLYVLDWDYWSLGIHVSPTGPNVQLHLPFLMIMIGFDKRRGGHPSERPLALYGWCRGRFGRWLAGGE